jgi:hypothetical protein
LRRIDTALEDDAVIDVVAQALEKRWPQSRRRGRLGTPAEVVIRMLILKHVFDWSYDDLEHDVRANLVYRAFTRIDAGDVPDAKTILKILSQFVAPSRLSRPSLLVTHHEFNRNSWDSSVIEPFSHSSSSVRSSADDSRSAASNLFPNSKRLCLLLFQLASILVLCMNS